MAKRKRTTRARATPRRPLTHGANDAAAEDDGPWSAEDPDRAFIAEADLFHPAVPLADAERAIDVRAGFLEALVGDPRVRHRLASWHARVIAAGDQGTADLGDAGPFVRDELGLPPWVLSALFDVFHRMGHLGVTDPVKELPDPAEAAVHAPPIQFAFWTLDGESTAEARSRLLALFAEAHADLLEAERAAGVGAAAGRRRARRGRAYLRAWGRWVYAAHVQRPPTTIRALAAAAKVDRKAIKRGIAEARYLLERGAYTWRGGGANKTPVMPG